MFDEDGSCLGFHGSNFPNAADEMSIGILRLRPPGVNADYDPGGGGGVSIICSRMPGRSDT